MKKLIFALLLFACLMLCSCAATADMEYGITEDNTAYVKLNIVITPTGFTDHEKHLLQETLQDLKSYYRDTLGFDTDYDYYVESERTAKVEFTLKKQGKDFEEAFMLLREMMTDESYSPFNELEMEHSDTKGEYAYKINGRIDAYRVIENTLNSGISDSTAIDIKKQLGSTSLSLTLDLPDQRKLTRLSFDEATEVALEGRVTVTKPLPVNYIIIGSAAGILVFGTVFIISVIKAKRTKDKHEQEEDNHTL